MYLKIVVAILFIQVSGLLVIATAQDYKNVNPEKKILLYNISLGSVIGGVGAVLNREKKAKIWKTFFNGILKGDLGGSFLYAGKRIASEVTLRKGLWPAIPSRLLHGVGMSMIENAALNERLLERAHLNFSFVRMDWHWEKQRLPYVRIQPFSLIHFILKWGKGNLNIKSSLMLGTPVIDEVEFEKERRLGLTYLQTILLRNEVQNDYKTTVHELVHVMQFQEYLLTNTLLNKVDLKLRKVGLYDVASKYIHLDWPVFLWFYHFEKDTRFGCPYDNFYELEAEHFSKFGSTSVCE